MLTNRSNYNYEVMSIEYQINNNEKRENGKEIYRRRDATYHPPPFKPLYHIHIEQ